MWDVCQYFGTFIAFYYFDSLAFSIMNSFKKESLVTSIMEDNDSINVFNVLQQYQIIHQTK